MQRCAWCGKDPLYVAYHDDEWGVPDDYRFREWRWFWDFGGGILTDLMVHYLDVAHWFLDLDHPDAAATIGDTFTPDSGWETPNTIQTLLHYGSRQVQVYFEGTFINARNAAMLEFMGTDATLYLDRGRYEIHPERAGTGFPTASWCWAHARAAPTFTGILTGSWCTWRTGSTASAAANNQTPRPKPA